MYKLHNPGLLSWTTIQLVWHGSLAMCEWWSYKYSKVIPGATRKHESMQFNIPWVNKNRQEKNTSLPFVPSQSSKHFAGGCEVRLKIKKVKKCSQNCIFCAWAFISAKNRRGRSWDSRTLVNKPTSGKMKWEIDRSEWWRKRERERERERERKRETHQAAGPLWKDKVASDVLAFLLPLARCTWQLHPVNQNAHRPGNSLDNRTSRIS